jgi:hypothetical protein
MDEKYFSHPKVSFSFRLVTLNHFGRNPNLGLATKARACKGATKSEVRESHFSVRECEGINPHTPKWAPTLGIRLLMDSQIFRKQFQGSKLMGLKSFLYHWKAS